MSTKFIAAKDLPVAEGDEVDVLCVENGTLKRKEGTSLGGGTPPVFKCELIHNTEQCMMLTDMAEVIEAYNSGAFVYANKVSAQGEVLESGFICTGCRYDSFDELYLVSFTQLSHRGISCYDWYSNGTLNYTSYTVPQTPGI